MKIVNKNKLSRINVVGLGIYSTEQLTIEGLNAAKNSNNCYYLGPNFENIKQGLIELGISDVKNIMHLYKDGEVDVEIYKKVCDFLIKSAIIHKSLALMVPGHPRLGVTLIPLLERNKNVEVKVFCGISCVDTLINDLKRDPIEYGSLIVDVNRLLLYDIPLNSAIDTYIFHICSIGTSRVYLSCPEKDNKILLLKKHLLRYYPEQHDVYAISSSYKDGVLFESYQYKVKEIENLVKMVHFGTTLYIPGMRPLAYNHEFLASLKEESL